MLCQMGAKEGAWGDPGHERGNRLKESLSQKGLLHYPDLRSSGRTSGEGEGGGVR